MSRIILKLSGEALAGPKGKGFDLDTVKMVAGQVRQLVEAGHDREAVPAMRSTVSRPIRSACWPPS